MKETAGRCFFEQWFPTQDFRQYMGTLLFKLAGCAVGMSWVARDAAEQLIVHRAAPPQQVSSPKMSIAETENL